MCVLADDLKFYARFRVSRSFGFLERRPLTTLGAKFEPWRRACDSLAAWHAAGRIRAHLEYWFESCAIFSALEELSADELVSHEELRLAHLLLVTLAAGYVWGSGMENASSSLPRQIAMPLYEVSRKLDVPPVIAHLSGCLANWRKIDESGELTAENFEIEIEMGPALYKMAECCDSIETGRPEERLVTEALLEIQTCLRKATDSLKIMRRHLSPAEFFHKLRPFLTGYHEGSIRESGLMFEGLEDLGPQRWGGGSAAQSSILHAVDAFLGVEHRGAHGDFLRLQQNSMPVPHRAFIRWLAESRPLLGFGDQALLAETLEVVKHFRSQHINLAAQFISTQKATSDRGTGGSSFVEFLRAVRADCAPPSSA